MARAKLTNQSKEADMKHCRSRFALVALAFVLLTGTFWAGGAPAAAKPAPTEAGIPSGEGPWVVRAYYTDPAMIDALAAWTEPWEVNRTEGYVVVDVDRAGYQWLLDAGFRVEVDARLTEQLNRPNEPLAGQTEGIPGYPCYRTVEETYATAQAIAAAHPNLATWTDIGDSWEKFNNPTIGYDMMVLRLTNAAIAGPKPKLFVMGAIHAREYTTAELVTRFAEYLVDNYGTDADVTWLLDYTEVHLLLQSNPDGRKKAETGQYWRKNTHPYGSCSPDSIGVDLNRNYEFQWGCCNGSSGYACDETYRGPSAASEPETQAVRDYVLAQFPDQRGPGMSDPAPVDATGLFMDIHSAAQLVLWPWGFTSTPAPNGTALQTLGRKFAYYNSYWPEQSYDLYVTDGTTDDFAYGDLGVAAFTFELGTNFFQDCPTFENTILPDNLQALIYAAKVSRTPYLTPAGPDALDVAAAPAAAVPGDLVHLTATLNDTRFNNQNGTEPTQNIAAGEYYIDVPPWVTTTTPIAYPMTAVDGSFDSTIEAAEATLDSSGLSSGRHTILVRGQDAAGNWGAFSAAFLYVVEPGVAPVIEGYVRDASDNGPLAATVTAGYFQAQTDPATGFYSMTVISDTYDLVATAEDHAPATVEDVVAADYQTVQQDFYLSPICEVFADDVEAGNVGWTAQSPWAITTEASHSPTHSWTDSPGGNYSNNRNISLTSPAFDLSDYQGVTLSFWHIYDLEPGWDYGYVEYSTNGSTWTAAATYSGYDHTTWEQQTIPLPDLDGQANARIRFHFTSDTSQVADGWHLDDIVLAGGGPACVTPVAPTAAFTSNSPVSLGEPVQFTNLTTGTTPIDYLWAFGDGDTSTESDPAHLYLVAGTFTVTLAATNTLGSDSVSHAVVVSPVECISITGVALTLDTAGPIYTGDTADLSADLLPNLATKPYTYTVDYGDGSPVEPATSSDDPLALSHAYTQVDTYTVEFGAWNCGLTEPLTDSVEIVVQEPPACVDLTGISIDGPSSGAPGYYTFTTSYEPLSATLPISYTWDSGDTGDTSIRALGVGTHTLVVTATNCGGAVVTDTHTVVVEGSCVEVTGIELTVVSAGPIYPNTDVEFQADLSPDYLSTPYTYTLAAGAPLTATADPLTFLASFGATGTHTVEIQVWNCAMTVPITGSVEVVVVEPPPFHYIYLPLIRKD
jgi:carboxypeptidase T